MQTRTVQVQCLSDLATEREIHEFFSFSGEIESMEIRRELGKAKSAFVTFKDEKALEIALLLSGATIIDQVVTITAAENYAPQPEIKVQESRIVDNAGSIFQQDDTSPVVGVTNHETIIPNNGREYVSKAQDVVSSMLAKGSAMRQDAMNKAKEFDAKHRLTANASARVISFDRRVGLSEKFTDGISVVNEKIKFVDQRFQVYDKTTAALMAAERKLNDTGSAVKSSRYVTFGKTWLNGALNKVTAAGKIASTKTREKWNVALSNVSSKDPSITA